jgi:tetratricopeptide (TPR) repeat protein
MKLIQLSIKPPGKKNGNRQPNFHSQRSQLCVGDMKSAMNFVDRSLDGNGYNMRAYALKSAILRHMGNTDEALKIAYFARQKCDNLDVHLMAEKWMAAKDQNVAKKLFATMNEHQATAMEVAASYYNCGLWSAGLAVLQQSVASAQKKTAVSPIVYYYMGYFAEKLGDNAKAAEYRRQAVIQSPDYVFPFQDELITVLNSAMNANPQDARAPYYMGSLLYDWQPEVATQMWVKSSEIDPNFAITWRTWQLHTHTEW